MPTCTTCSREYDGDECPSCGSTPQLILHDDPVPDTSPWWAQPTDFYGWKLRIGLLMFAVVAAVWTVRKFGRTLAMVAGAVAIAALVVVIWLRYRDDKL